MKKNQCENCMYCFGTNELTCHKDPPVLTEAGYFGDEWHSEWQEWWSFPPVKYNNFCMHFSKKASIIYEEEKEQLAIIKARNKAREEKEQLAVMG